MIQRYLAVICLLLPTAPAWATKCDMEAHRAHRLAIEGEPVAVEKIPPVCFGNIATPPAGSGNWPVMLRGVLYITGESDGRDLLPWLEGGKVWSHNGREGGSTIYEPWNTATALAVLHVARQKKHADLERQASRWLRALWAKYALAATPFQSFRMRFWQHTARHERRRLRYLGYVGPMVHLAGNRQAENPKREHNTGAWTEVNAGPPMLAWAADWPERKYKAERILPGVRSVGLWTIRELTGKGYEETVDPAVFGLTAQERKTLLAFLQEPTDEALARQVATWLDGYPFWPKNHLIFRRYESGAVLTVMRNTFNGSKSGAVAVLGQLRTSTWLLPAAFDQSKAARSQGIIVRDKVIATSEDRGRWDLSLARLGPIAWQAKWSGDGVVFEDLSPADEAETQAAEKGGSAPSKDSRDQKGEGSGR